MTNRVNKYWNTYNQEKNSLIKKIVKFNNKHDFNFFEFENYNHIRDILALALIFAKKNKKKITVLDYGSNLLTISNLNKKIETKNINFDIFDPFYTKQKNNINIKNIKYKIFNKEKDILKKSYDLINFGSSIQYQKNFFNNFQKFNLKKTRYIVFTSTPFSLSKTYYTKQLNHSHLIQNIFSIKELIEKLKLNKFNLIFKSRNDDKYISCKFKRFKTYSLNLIFNK